MNFYTKRMFLSTIKLSKLSCGKWQTKAQISFQKPRKSGRYHRYNRNQIVTQNAFCTLIIARKSSIYVGEKYRKILIYNSPNIYVCIGLFRIPHGHRKHTYSIYIYGCIYQNLSKLEYVWNCIHLFFIVNKNELKGGKKIAYCSKAEFSYVTCISMHFRKLVCRSAVPAWLYLRNDMCAFYGEYIYFSQHIFIFIYLFIWLCIYIYIYIWNFVWKT